MSSVDAPAADPAQRVRRPAGFAWYLLCGMLAAGLAWWSLYIVGLLFLVLAAYGLGGMPESPRQRLNTVLSMIAGFETSMACLIGLYWFVWHQPDVGFYGYLAALAIGGLAILSVLGVAHWKAATTSVTGAAESDSGDSPSYRRADRIGGVVACINAVVLAVGYFWASQGEGVGLVVVLVSMALILLAAASLAAGFLSRTADRQSRLVTTVYITWLGLLTMMLPAEGIGVIAIPGAFAARAMFRGSRFPKRTVLGLLIALVVLLTVTYVYWYVTSPGDGPFG